MARQLSEQTPELRGARVVLRRLREEDVPTVLRIAREPEVEARWPRANAEDFTKLARGEEADTVGWCVLVDGQVAGLIQYWEETDPDYRHAGIDIILSSAFHGRGLGTDAVATLARHLLHDLGHHRLVIDPAADNARAIRCYEKVGFRPVGTMRSYERGLDGTFHDGLLMDMLRDDLRG